MEAFWRYRPVVDRWLAEGGFFHRIDPYLCDPALSFPYRRKPVVREIPFVDHVTAVRLLGGWNRKWKNGEVVPGRPVEDYDLAYRGPDGRIRYRWSLLGPRLDPYVRNGYGLTIVLDNTPWCFPRHPVAGDLGQAAPPADFAEWQGFIEELCRQLVERYGFETANRFRFRMGTECQGRARFAGTPEQFFRLYDHAAAGVKRVLPGAEFGPFNLAGSPDTGNVQYYGLADHCVSGRNTATDGVGAPLDFAAVSLYTAPSVLRGILRTTDPEFKARQKIDFWDGLARGRPRLSDVSREVHEFGILNDEFRSGSSEPGARGAAWFFHVMMALREGGMERLWHWGVYESINVGTRHLLPTGPAWLFTILEHTLGGETYVLDPDVRPVAGEAPEALPADLRRIAMFRRPEPLARPGRLFVKSIAVVFPKRTFVITSVYNEDRFAIGAVDISVPLPKSVAVPAYGVRVRQTVLSRTGSVYFRIRRDLAAAGLLDPEFAAVPGLLGSVRRMGGRAAWKYVDEHWPRYEAIVRDSLTLKSFDGRVRRCRGRVAGLSFRLRPSAVLVVVLDAGSRERGSSRRSRAGGL